MPVLNLAVLNYGIRITKTTKTTTATTTITIPKTQKKYQ